MSFFGKQFKKVKAENAGSVIGKLKLSEQIMSLLQKQNSVTTFTKNEDGTLQYVVKASDGQTVLDQVIELSKEKEFQAPDGMNTKVKYTLEGDVLKSHMHFPDGNVIHMDRHFEANAMTLELYIKGDPDKAKVYYEVV